MKKSNKLQLLLWRLLVNQKEISYILLKEETQKEDKPFKLTPQILPQKPYFGWAQIAYRILELGILRRSFFKGMGTQNLQIYEARKQFTSPIK